MPTELTIDAGVLFSFLLALSRVGAMVAFVPFPGMRTGVEIPRIVFAVLATWCMRPVWPVVATADVPAGRMLMWVLSEAALGITLGLLVSMLVESFQIGAQVLGIQAGYSYASTIDPTTQADSGLLVIMIQLMAGICFFIAGVDHHVIRAVAVSFERIQPGSFAISSGTVQTAIDAGTAMFATGLRIALPVVAFLTMVDLALALLGRMQTQLQLISLAFPAKMLVTMVMLAALAALLPRLFEAAAQRALVGVGKVLGG